MLKKASSFVLGHPSPCDVPKAYVSVAGLPAALLDGLFDHPADRLGFYERLTGFWKVSAQSRLQKR